MADGKQGGEWEDGASLPELSQQRKRAMTMLIFTITTIFAFAFGNTTTYSQKKNCISQNFKKITYASAIAMLWLC